jgi:hypothetical protein
VFRVAVTGARVIPLCVTMGIASLEPGCSDDGIVSVACISCGDLDAEAGSTPEGGRDAADVGFTDAPDDVMHTVALDAFSVADVGFSDVHHDGPLGVALDAFGGG